MPESSPRVTERTYYPFLQDILRDRAGATSVTEVSFNSEPDILFEIPQLPNLRWLLSVKIGQDPRTLTSAFIQFQRHKQDSGLNHGAIVFLKDNARAVSAEEASLREYLDQTHVLALIDTPWVKEEVQRYPFAELAVWLVQQVVPRIRDQQSTAYPLTTIVTLLREHVNALMADLHLEQQDLLQLITNERLFSHFAESESVPQQATVFLAAYIFLSQVLFLELYASVHREVAPPRDVPISRETLRQSFRLIRRDDYEPIYDLDVIDHIPDRFLRETYDLLHGLAIERVRMDIAGRLFHDLMPPQVRKLLAAFYTRPQAAAMLAHLSISDPFTTVWDPACGSGTIMVAAYRRKFDLYHQQGNAGSPHRRFVENDLSGIDIMPFAVHLTSANLASLDPGTTIDHIPILRQDSLSLVGGESRLAGVQASLLPDRRRESMRAGTDQHEVTIEPKDAVLMNPPFTKVERGIAEWVNMVTFRRRVGGEVGLWGHFLAFADQVLLRNQGTVGAVLPINLLRGRESDRVRSICFREWTPLFVVKPTLNYGFSEFAEYRDILFVARKEHPTAEHMVRFALVKRDLARLSLDEAENLANLIQTYNHLRSEEVDIESFPLSVLYERFDNMMWFLGVSDFGRRDTLITFVSPFQRILRPMSEDSFVTGIRFEARMSEVAIFARERTTSRLSQAKIFFTEDSGDGPLHARTLLGTPVNVERAALMPAFRSAIGVTRMDITGNWDYLALRPYRGLPGIERAFDVSTSSSQWRDLSGGIERATTQVCVVHRVNPYSPATRLLAFYSDSPFVPTDTFHAVHVNSPELAKALTVLYNSAVFLIQWLLAKEESGGRNINIRIYDLEAISLLPPPRLVPALAEVYDRFAQQDFPPLHEQLDIHFQDHYEAFWSTNRENQPSLFASSAYEPHPLRLQFDLAVCRALRVSMSANELRPVYEALAKEMVITRGLRSD
jgi:hypothetical protein